MRVALKIAYDGRAFYGHQRQPDRRTVEGECLAALRSARILTSPGEAFFRSASRTDRGVSAVGNVIAFNSSLKGPAVVGAFNDKARDVWAWAYAEVSDSFHPRHARERWYRYVLLEKIPDGRLREAGQLFVGTHDFQSFCSEPLTSPFSLDRVDVSRSGEATLVDLRARSFRRGMVRRIVSAMLAAARGDASLEELRATLAGVRHDFGAVLPEPLVLMDVSYDFEFRAIPKPKALDEWARLESDAVLRLRFFDDLRRAVETGSATRPQRPSGGVSRARDP